MPEASDNLGWNEEVQRQFQNNQDVMLAALHSPESRAVLTGPERQGSEVRARNGMNETLPRLVLSTASLLGLARGEGKEGVTVIPACPASFFGWKGFGKLGWKEEGSSAALVESSRGL